MSSRSWPIGVRVARPEDRDSVLAFATSTWNGWDYIPEVWDDWVVPSDGVVLVATVGQPRNGDQPLDHDGAPLTIGQPVAMTRLAMLSAVDAWLEGIRVDPRVRGMGVATDLQVAELRWIAAHGASVVRYMTSEANIGSQRLGAHHGLLEIGRWRSYQVAGADHEAGTPSTPEMEAALSGLGRASADSWARVRADPAFEAAHGLYEYRPWGFLELTAERFARHVERDEVVSASGGADWATLIVNRRQLADGRLHVAYAGGGGAPLIDLLVGLGRPNLRVPDPDPPQLRVIGERFVAEGYTPWEGTAIVVERRLDAGGHAPVPDDPSRLVYLDEPRRIAVPKSLDP